MSTSYWLESVSKKSSFPSFSGRREHVEVLVIGGGITGLMTAYHLSKAGKKVMLIEKDGVGEGESGYTTAFLMYATDAYLYELHGAFGDEGAKLAWQSGKEIINRIESIIDEEGIACDFRRTSAYLGATDEEGRKELKKEYELGRELGFPFLWSQDGHPWARYGTLEIPEQAAFHPYKFMQGVSQAIVRYGGSIFEHTKVQAFDEARGMEVEGGAVTADHFVVATHSPIDNRFEGPARLSASQSYVLGARIAKGVFSDGLYLDTEKPYHYVRLHKESDHDVLILGGEDRLTGDSENTDQRYKELERFLQKEVLKDIPYTITHRWSGQILDTADGLPYIGRSLAYDNHYIATGYAGNGMTFGSIAGTLISDLILGRENPYEDLYTPKRVKGVGSILKFGARFAKELIQDRLSTSESEIETIKPGEGKIVEEEGKKIAVFRTPGGKIIRCSAICTHLGCVVGWNGAEKTWDCPCHGSRFDVEGNVLNGPAVEPLASIGDR